MPGKGYEAAVLLADITGSTPLYEDLGDAAASSVIGECLDALRSIVREEGGTFIRTKGDDVLCAFSDPSAALSAAREMLSRPLTGSLEIHAGMHFGPIIQARDDLFGDAVNLTARLAELANPGEVLLSKSLVEKLSKAETRSLRVLDKMTFKGKRTPTEVYSLLEADRSQDTEVPFGDETCPTETRYLRSVPEVTVTLRYRGRAHECGGSESLSIGRASACDIVIRRPWVSRRHAMVSVRGGRVHLDDQSSAGTYVSVGGGHEFFMRREDVILTGSGVISPVMRPKDAEAEVVHYEVVGEPPAGDS